MKAFQNILSTSMRTVASLLILLGAGVNKVVAQGENTTSTSTAPVTTPTPVPFSGTGTLRLIVFPSSPQGCLLSDGLWSTAGTCGTFTATASGSAFTLKTSSGNCGILSGLFACQSGLTSSTFSAIGNFLAFEGNDLFSADIIPVGVDQETINAGIGPNNVIIIEVEWEST